MTNQYGKPVWFIHFPGKEHNKAAARVWINACCRPRNHPSLENLSYHHFICSLHWVGEDGPTELNPNRIPATITEVTRYKRDAAFWRRTNTSHPPQGNIQLQVSEGLGDSENGSIAKILLDFSSQPVNHAPDKDNDSQMLAAAHALLELSSGCSYLDCEALETAGNGSMPICLKMANHSTQTREFEGIVRKHLIEKMLYHPMFYTGLKSRKLIEFFFWVGEGQKRKD